MVLNKYLQATCVIYRFFEVVLLNVLFSNAFIPLQKRVGVVHLVT